MKGFASPRSFSNGDNLKKVALEMSKLCSDKAAISFDFLIDSQSLVGSLIDEEVFVIDIDDFKDLAGWALIFVDD